jgi:hypothetical protein
MAGFPFGGLRHRLPDDVLLALGAAAHLALFHPLARHFVRREPSLLNVVVLVDLVLSAHLALPGCVEASFQAGLTESLADLKVGLCIPDDRPAEAGLYDRNELTA